MKVLKIAMLAATLLPLASYAVLGGAPSSSSSSPVMLRATPQSADAASTGTGAASATTAAPYTVRESRDADGVTIREYVLPSNVVFAVTLGRAHTAGYEGAARQLFPQLRERR
jgi:Protein of unknown function (DUF2844).